MPLKIKCPEGHTLTVPGQRAGKSVRCPICMLTFEIPADAGSNSSEEFAPPPGKKKKKLVRKKRVRTEQRKSTSEKKDEERISSKDASRRTKKRAKVRVKQTPLKESAETPVSEKARGPDEGIESIPIRRKKKKSSEPTVDTPTTKKDDQEKTSKKKVVKKKVINKKVAKKRAPPKDPGKPTPNDSKPTPKKQNDLEPAPALLPPIEESAPLAAKGIDPKTSPQTAAREKNSATSTKDRKEGSGRWKTDDQVVKQTTPREEPNRETPQPKQEAPSQQAPKQQAAKSEPPSLLPSNEEQAEIQGVEHDLGRRWTAYYLGIALAICGILNTCPAYFDIYGYYDLTNPQPIHRWTYIVFFIGGLQVAYALYLIQVPDWSSVWVVAILTLLLATGYAMVLGLIVLGKENNNIVQLLGLATTSPRSATLWCFSMLSALSLITYFCGREGMQWYKIYTIQGEVAATKEADAS